MTRNAGAFAVALFALGLPSMASAATFTINETADLALHPTALDCECRVDSRGTRCSLRAAIQAANACPGHDVVEVTPIGPFLLSIGGPGEDAGAGGDLDVTESVTIDGNGQWIRTAVLDRILDVQVPVGHDVNVSDLRMSYGSILGTPADANGGGIRSIDAVLTLESIHLDQNHAAAQGGGLYTQGGELTLLDTVLEANSAADGGGARIAEPAAATLQGARFLSNQASTFGGGLLVHVQGTASVDIQDTELSRNEADTGAGALVWSSSLAAAVSFDGCHFYRNLATFHGGGLVTDVDGLPSEVSVTNSLFELNQAVVGGAMLGAGAVSRSTFRGNAAAIHGGAIALREEAGLSVNAPVLVDNSTFLRNHAQYGGALFATQQHIEATHVTLDANSATASGAAVYSSVPVMLRSSIVSALGTPPVSHCNAPVSVGHNVATDLTCLALGTDLLVSNAGLGAYGNHGGPTPTIALITSSPAIDAADPATCPPIDQRGLPRPSGAGCDAGAYERQPGR